MFPSEDIRLKPKPQVENKKPKLNIGSKGKVSVKETISTNHIKNNIFRANQHLSHMMAQFKAICIMGR